MNVLVAIDATARQYDPTGTTTVRRRYEAEAVRRFRRLRALVVQAVAENDVLGLGPARSTTDALMFARVFGSRGRVDDASAPATAFTFTRSSDRVGAFLDWLREAADDEILSVRTGTTIRSSAEQGWQNVYIDTAYQKGIRDAYQNTGDPLPGGSITAAFNQPVHADRVGLVYTRAYEALRGVTEAVSSQMSRTLARAVAEGVGMRETARRLARDVDDIGIKRARVIARTETISAHAEASLNSYEEAGLEDVAVRAEWATARDSRVCPRCAEREGKVYLLSEARGLIPLHPNCRCAWIPVVPVEQAPSEAAPKPMDDLDPHSLDLTNEDDLEFMKLADEVDVDERIGLSHIELPDTVDLEDHPSLGYYVDEGYNEINAAIRGDSRAVGPDLAEHIKNLNELMSPSRQSYIVFRTVRDSDEVGLGNLKSGDVVGLDGFVSASRNPLMSTIFSGHRDAMFQISVPKGTPMIVTNPAESEVILHPGTKIRINSVREMDIKGAIRVVHTAELVEVGAPFVPDSAFDGMIRDSVGDDRRFFDNPVARVWRKSTGRWEKVAQ